MSVILVRHGEADAAGCCYGARHDVPLSAAGRAQAAAVAARVGESATLVSSPARRALETAACFGEPARDVRWIERDFGTWEGRSWADCWAEVPEEITRDPDRYAAFTPPEGEPLDAVQARVGLALDALVAELADGPVVIVTHAGPIRLALRHVLGLTVRQCFAFSPAPGSATWLRRVGDSWVVDRVGA